MDKDKFSDRGYKLLFSHPKMVKDLIESFVKEDFKKEIDFKTLKPYKGSFVSKSFKNRETDVIWEVNIKGKSSFIYILVEFQSTVDKYMSLRLLTYICLFYEHLLREREELKMLPSVFPIVLYNGDDKWTAPLDIEKLIDIPFPSMRSYLPGFKYYKIAENEFSKESLLKIQNLVARLFLIENSNVKELGEIIEDVIKVLKSEVNRELQLDFGLWLRGILKRKNFDVDINDLDEMEVKDMLLTKLEKFEEEVLEKGRKEEKLDIAKKALERGLKVDIIAEITGLTLEIIKSLKDSE